MTGPLTFDELVAHLSDRLELDPDDLQPDRLLIDDLGLDSIQLIELVSAMDELVPGWRLPEQLDPIDICLRDVHHYVTIAAEHSEPPSSTRPIQ